MKVHVVVPFFYVHTGSGFLSLVRPRRSLHLHLLLCVCTCARYVMGIHAIKKGGEGYAR